MKLLSKPDAFTPAFIVNGPGASGAATCNCCGQPVTIAHNCQGVTLADGVTFDGEELPVVVTLQEGLSPGSDYWIALEGERLVVFSSPHHEALGGFHVGLDGKILAASVWDRNFRPKCGDARGMVRVGTYWVDIYLTGTDAWSMGSSRAGMTIADGSNPPYVGPVERADRFNFWIARDLLAGLGKQLLSMAEFAEAMAGVEEGKSLGSDPQTTGHAPGHRSAVGIEQATGCMWTWSRDVDEIGYSRLMGGHWDTSRAGARRFYGYCAHGSDYYVGARGRCDHLILE